MKNVEVAYCDTDISIVKLYGEHDLGDSEELRNLLERQLAPSDLLIVDLSETEFIDSSILNTLIAVKKIADRHGLSVTLQLGAETNARKILEVSGLDGFFHCTDSRPEAIALARNSR